MHTHRESTRGTAPAHSRGEAPLAQCRREDLPSEVITPIAEKLEQDDPALAAIVVTEWIGLGLISMQGAPEREGAGASFYV